MSSTFIMRPQLVKYFPSLTHLPFFPFYSKEMIRSCSFTEVWETGIKAIFNFILIKAIIEVLSRYLALSL